MRARSTDASVCPGRTSTPPVRARSGKTWPGRARSCGRVLGSTAVRMVVARSAAEMPVVTPLRASTETVKAVPRKEVLSATCIVRCSSSQRSSVSGMQMRPRACVVMKLMISGVIFSAAQARSPSFSRSSSSTMIISRPSLMSRAASSMEAKGMLKIARQTAVREMGKSRAMLPETGAFCESEIAATGGPWRGPPVAATGSRRCGPSVGELRDAVDDRGRFDDGHALEPVGLRLAPLVHHVADDDLADALAESLFDLAEHLRVLLARVADEDELALGEVLPHVLHVKRAFGETALADEEVAEDFI